ncbi:NAD(P)/FAD-dependent oxidoreductase [Virgibacillus kimchii]
MKVDVVIIGAGPAGLTAAIEIIQNGLTVAVIDEYYRPGGRLLGQHYEDPYAPRDQRIWDGKKTADQLEEKARSLGVHIFTNVSVWSVSGKWKVELAGSELTSITSKVLLLATGSVEKALPVPGWTLPGVISVGAAQTFTNLHQVSVGKKVLIAGIDPLSLSVMMEMKNAGIDVAGMVLPPMPPVTGKDDSPSQTVARLKDVAGLAPNLLVRKLGKLALTRVPRLTAHGLRFNLLKVNGVPIHLRKAIVEIEGQGKVEAVKIQSVSVDGRPVGKAESVEVDTVCLSNGLYPLVDLAETAGCRLIDIPELGGTVPLHAPDMSTQVSGLFVAGNITGIEGAKVAMAQGRLAAASILKSLGKPGSTTVDAAMTEVNHARRTAPLRFLPEIDHGRQKMNSIWQKEGIV